MPQLSPSPELFTKYSRFWKHEAFTNDELDYMMNIGTTNSWWDLYVKEFINEIKEREDFRACINRVMQLLDSGENVMLICFCGDVNRCHRGIIGYFLKKKNYDVHFN